MKLFLFRNSDQRSTMIFPTIEIFGSAAEFQKHLLNAQKTVANAFEAPVLEQELPSPATFCPTSLIGSLGLLFDPINVSLSEGAKDTRHETQNTIVAMAFRWLTHRRSKAHIIALLGSTCQCAITTSLAHFIGNNAIMRNQPDLNEIPGYDPSPGWHKYHPTSGCHLVHQILVYAVRLGDCDCCPRALEHLTHRRHWPHSLSELLPNGPLNTCFALSRWMGMEKFQLWTQGKSSHMMAIIFEISHSVLLPELAIWVPTLIYAISWHVGKTREYIATESRGIQPGDIEALYHASRVMKYFRDTTMMQTWLIYTLDEGLQALLLESCTAALVFSSVIQSQRCDDPALQSMLHQIAASCVEFGGILLDNDASQIQYTFKSFLNSIVRKETVPSIVFAGFGRHRFKELSEHASHYCQIQDCFIYLAHDQRCHNEQCPRTFADIGGRMKRCSRCYRVQYCSRRCQKKAWTQGQWPHQGSCSLFEQIVQFGNFRDLESRPWIALGRSHLQDRPTPPAVLNDEGLKAAKRALPVLRHLFSQTSRIMQ